MTDAVVVEQLVKTFGSTRALDGVSLRIPQGTVLGVLGPNGAGKTTLVRALATLLRPDSGRAEVLGIDVLREPDRVRRVIGLAGQYAAIDERLTGRENLELVGRLHHFGKRALKARAGELLERFDLTDASERLAKTYSGGMRRRLDLAASLVNTPQVLFLDEPTTGLDPRSRLGMWEVIEALVRDGTTLLLTTQYLEEADLLADEIVVIDHGKVIANGTADQLKMQVGGERLEVTVADPARLAEARRLLAPLGVGAPVLDVHRRAMLMPVTGGISVLREALRLLEDGRLTVEDAGLRRPTLDDVFLTLTGHAADDDTATATTPESSPATEKEVAR